MHPSLHPTQVVLSKNCPRLNDPQGRTMEVGWVATMGVPLLMQATLLDRQ